MEFLNTRTGEPSFVPTSAWLEHGPFAMWLVRRMRPRRIVELGTHYGFSYFAMCQAVAEENLPAQCFAVDTWHGDEHAGFYDASIYDGVSQENQKYEHFSTLLRKTFSEALRDIEDKSVDLLHVDGRHFYADVKQDFESWIPKLSDSAVVLFHDTEVYERDFGVYKYWHELSADKPSLNFLHGHGLGVLLWGPKIADEVHEVLNAKNGSNIYRGMLLDYFSAAGKSFVRLHQHAYRISELESKQRDLEVKLAMLTSLERERSELEARLVDRDGKLAVLEKRLEAAKHENLKAQAANSRPIRQLRRHFVKKLLNFIHRVGLPLPKRLKRRLD